MKQLEMSKVQISTFNDFNRVLQKHGFDTQKPIRQVECDGGLSVRYEQDEEGDQVEPPAGATSDSPQGGGEPMSDPGAPAGEVPAEQKAE